MTNSVPKEEGIDHSLNLLREGYLYILNRRQSFHSDLFETRLLGKKAVCMGGKEAADLFYDNSKFKRAGVAPNRVAETLFGKRVYRHWMEMPISTGKRCLCPLCPRIDLKNE